MASLKGAHLTGLLSLVSFRMLLGLFADIETELEMLQMWPEFLQNFKYLRRKRSNECVVKMVTNRPKCRGYQMADCTVDYIMFVFTSQCMTSLNHYDPSEKLFADKTLFNPVHSVSRHTQPIMVMTDKRSHLHNPCFALQSESSKQPITITNA